MGTYPATVRFAAGLLLLKWHRQAWGAAILAFAGLSPIVTSDFWSAQFRQDDLYWPVLLMMVIVFGGGIAWLAKFRSQRRVTKALMEEFKADRNTPADERFSD